MVKERNALRYIHIGSSIDGISGCAVVGFPGPEGRLTGLAACRDAFTQSFSIASLSPHAGLQQVSPSCLGVTAGSHPGQVGSLSRGPERQTTICTHTNSDNNRKVVLFWFVLAVCCLFLTKCDNLLKTRRKLNVFNCGEKKPSKT